MRNNKRHWEAKSTRRQSMNYENPNELAQFLYRLYMKQKEAKIIDKSFENAKGLGPKKEDAHD